MWKATLNPVVSEIMALIFSKAQRTRKSLKVIFSRTRGQILGKHNQMIVGVLHLMP
jgi:hypothetical protein